MENEIFFPSELGPGSGHHTMDPSTCMQAQSSSILPSLAPISDFDMRHFWQWSDFQSYVECIMSLAVVGAVLMYFLNDFDPFVEGVGFAAVFTEACLGLPQFYRNAKNKSTYGMR